MKKHLVFLIGSLMFFGIVGGANATVINFDKLEEAGTSETSISWYSEDGFTFNNESNDLSYWQQAHPQYDTSAGLFDGMAKLIKLSNIDHETFTLKSIDLDIINSLDKGDAEFTAYNIDGDWAATRNYSWYGDGWKTVNFDAAFEDILWVEIKIGFENYNFQIDNVVLIKTSPVPEPATMLLFSIGLLGLAGVNRRKRITA